MTQEEVDLIYDYLHEHYRYEDGDLLRVTKTRYISASRIGEKLGYVQIGKRKRIALEDKFQINLKATLHVNKKKYTKSLSHFVWIFHKKTEPKIIYMKDNNIMNTRIENLINLDEKRVSDRHRVSNHIYAHGNRFRVAISYKNTSYFVGIYEEHKDAEKPVNFIKKRMKENNIEIPDIVKLAKKNYPGTNSRTKRKYPTGVYQEPHGYRARIWIEGKMNTIGTFPTPEEAHEAYLKAKKDYEDTKILPKTSS